MASYTNYDPTSGGSGPYVADPNANIPSDPSARGSQYAQYMIGGSPSVYGWYSPYTTYTAAQAGSVMKALDPLGRTGLDNGKDGGGGGGYGSYMQNLQLRLAEIAAKRDQMYAEGKNHYKNIYNTSKKQLDLENERAQRENYIANKINTRDFRQINAAQGLSGGASETALASIYNRYAANRNATEQTNQDNQRKLSTEYANNLYNLYLEYMNGKIQDDLTYAKLMYGV